MATHPRDPQPRGCDQEDAEDHERHEDDLCGAARARAAGGRGLAARTARSSREVLASVAGGVEADAHPLLAARPRKRKLDVLLFTSDRGLCGALQREPDQDRASALVARSRDEFDLDLRDRDRAARARLPAPPAHRQPAASWIGVAQPTAELAREIAEYRDRALHQRARATRWCVVYCALRLGAPRRSRAT